MKRIRIIPVIAFGFDNQDSSFIRDVSRKLNAIVRIKYQNSAQKLAAWTVASHLEKAPKPKAPTPTA